MTKPYQFYLINLDRSPERLAVQKAQFDRLGFSFIRIAAVDGRELGDDLPGLDQKAYLSRHGKTVHPNELGCYLSHVRTIEAFMASDAEFAVILEDDAGLADDAEQALDALVAARDHWDVVNLNGRHRGGPVRCLRLTPSYDLVCYFFRRTGGAGYMINRKAGQKYLDNLLPMKVPYDHEYDRAWIYGFKYRGIQPVVVQGMTGAASTIGYTGDSADIAPVAGSNRKRPWYKRGSVVLYRGRNEVSRLLYYTLRGKFIPRS